MKKVLPFKVACGLAAALALLGAGLVAITASPPVQASTAAGEINRAEVLQRAAHWYAQDPARYDGGDQGQWLSDVDGGHRYRRDCSGFVAMALHLSSSPSSFQLSGSSYGRRISNQELKPGDYLTVDDDGSGGGSDGHVVLFEGWAPAYPKFKYYGFGGTDGQRNGLRHRIGDFSGARTLPTGGGGHEADDGSNAAGQLDGHATSKYQAYRYNKIVDVSQVSSRAIPYKDGSLQVFQRDTQDNLQHWYDLNGWHRDGAVPNGKISSPPAVIEYLGQIHVFARAASSNTLHHSWYDNGWHVENLGGSVLSTPSATLYSDGTLQVFARGSGAKLQHWYFTDRWIYEAWGDTTGGDPVAIEYLGQIHVFARADNNALYHRWWDRGWHTESLPGPIFSEPAVALWGNQLHVFSRGENGSLKHNWQDGGWYQETLAGGTVLSRPTAVADPNDGTLQVFARGFDNHLQHWYFLNGWHHETQSDVISGHPSAVVKGAQLHVFARGANDGLLHTWWDARDRSWFHENLLGSFAAD